MAPCFAACSSARAILLVVRGLSDTAAVAVLLPRYDCTVPCAVLLDSSDFSFSVFVCATARE